MGGGGCACSSGVGLLVATAPAGARTAAVEAAPAPPEARQLVGRAHGSQAYVGFLVRGSDVVVYLCDGRPDRRRAERTSEWFRGRLQGSSLVLRSRGGAVLDAHITRGTATGTLRLADGRTLTFTARLATGKGAFVVITEPPSKPRTGRLVLGWISLPGGSQRGSVSLTCRELNGVIKYLKGKEVTGTISDDEERLLPTYINIQRDRCSG